MLTVFDALSEPIPESLLAENSPEPTVAELDQLQAASDESWETLKSILPDSDENMTVVNNDTSDEYRERGAFILLTFFDQRGVDFSCPHVQNMRSPFPVLFVPRYRALGCRRCIGNFILEALEGDEIDSLQFLECDFCQVPTSGDEGGEIISVMGPVTIVGHYCDECMHGWRQLLAVS